MEVNVHQQNVNSPGSPEKLVRTDNDRPELGSARGAFVLPDDWDAPLTDAIVEDLFGA